MEFDRPREQLRILVDGRVMQDRYHGIGRVTFELLRELSTRDVRLIVLHSRDSGRLPVSELLAQPSVQPVPSYAPVASLRSQLELRRVIRRFRPDAIYIPYHLATPWLRTGVPVVTVIHDCLLERQAAQHRRSAFSVLYRLASRLAIRSSAAVLVPTHATRRDVQRFYGITLADEAVIPWGVGAQFFAVGTRVGRRPAGLPDRYVLHVGARRPHKNQKVLVAALAELLGGYPGLGLVLAGQHDPRVADEAGELITELGLSDHVRQYTRVGDDMLLDLYANAAAFAFPSLVEGFGLPVLEAMAAGLPVVASDAEAVQEAAGDGATIVPAQSAADWAKALDQVLGDPGYSAELRDRGMAVAARRTWARAADLTLEAITRLVKRSELHTSAASPLREFIMGESMTGTLDMGPDQRGAAHAWASNATKSQPLDVLVITSEAPPIVSGISTCIARLTGGLADRGHRVRVLSSADIPRFSLGELRLSSFAAHWPRIARELRHFDVVNVHGPAPTMSDAFLRLSALLPEHARPAIVYTHHSPIDIPGARRASVRYNKIHDSLALRADRIVASSEHYAGQYRSRYGPRAVAIPWGVDVRSAPPSRRKAPPDPLNVLFVGQMRPYKGVETLLAAVAGQPWVKLTLVGGGTELGTYERLGARFAAANAEFLGRLSDERLQQQYDANDVVVLPSVTQSEAFGLVLLEGMAAGCVPVASDLPGVRDVAGPTGLLVPPGRPGALRSALLELWCDSARLDRLKGDSWLAAQPLSWERCVASYEDVLMDAVRGRYARRHGLPVPPDLDWQ
jgi:glycosyltransferase involved in cell wall biosynthesis